MAHSHPYDEVWLWTAQTGFQRCSLIEMWVDTRKAALALPVWGSVHSGTCVQLPKRSLAFNQTQSGLGHHSTAAHRGLLQCLD